MTQLVIVKGKVHEVKLNLHRDIGLVAWKVENEAKELLATGGFDGSDMNVFSVQGRIDSDVKRALS